MFASGPHLPMAKWLLSEVHERLEPRHLIGCGAGGTLASGREIEEGPGLAVWAATLPGAELSTLHVTAERGEQDFRLLGHAEAAARRGGEWHGRRWPLCWPTPTASPLRSCCASWSARRPGVPVLGGLASASVGGGTVLLQDGEVRTEGAVAAVLAGLEVLPCVSQGAMPVGPEMTVTAAEGERDRRAGRQVQRWSGWAR